MFSVFLRKRYNNIILSSYRKRYYNFSATIHFYVLKTFLKNVFGLFKETFLKHFYYVFVLLWCSLLCLSDFLVWFWSLGFIVLISTRILAPLITLSRCDSVDQKKSEVSTWSLYDLNWKLMFIGTVVFLLFL